MCICLAFFPDLVRDEAVVDRAVADLADEEGEIGFMTDMAERMRKARLSQGPWQGQEHAQNQVTASGWR